MYIICVTQAYTTAYETLLCVCVITFVNTYVYVWYVYAMVNI